MSLKPAGSPQDGGLQHVRGSRMRVPYGLLAATLTVIVGIGVTLCAIHWR